MAMMLLPLERLIESFRTLPGIGRKTAARLAMGILDMSEEDAVAFATSVLNAKKEIGRCPNCNNLCEVGNLCDVCLDSSRDASVICAVEDAKAVMAMEKIRDFNGVYHVLGGTISPMDGIGPEQLQIESLKKRVAGGKVSEVIIATNPTPEGETTAVYISRLLKPYGVKISRLAYGIPVGADLEYADEMTLLRAMEGRREF